MTTRPPLTAPPVVPVPVLPLTPGDPKPTAARRAPRRRAPPAVPAQVAVVPPAIAPAAAAQPAEPPGSAPSPEQRTPARRLLIGAAAVLVLAAIGVGLWLGLRDTGPGKGFVSGNGRIEATEIDVAAKVAGRVADVLVDEGDFVAAGQTLGHMRLQVLDAEREQAQATQERSVSAVAAAHAEVSARRGEVQAAQALVAQRGSELTNAGRRRDRSVDLARDGAASQQEVDDDGARVSVAGAALTAARAQVAAAGDAVVAAQAQVAGAQDAVHVAEAGVAVVDANILDSALTAPRDARVQYRIAQPGEIMAAGGKLLNLVDLSDVHMTYFVSEDTAGRLELGSEVHIVLDAAPTYVIPARVTFVASIAQFTPKTVETASERQKLMFRVKAQIDPELLKRNRLQVKAGLPGVAWMKVDPQSPWPAELTVKVPQ